MEFVLDPKMILSGLSFVFTTYFWFVKARKEKPHLEFYQLSDFRASCRRHPDRAGMKRLCLQQLETGGVLIVNHSTRQNSIVLFYCSLRTDRGTLHGDWGYGGEDKPPWNVGPETALAFSPACFFDVPEDYEVPESLEFRIDFITASGKTFAHKFTKSAPRLQSERDQVKQAA